MKELILATANAGKVAELKSLLAPRSCITQRELGISSAAETGLSFIENAIIKARHVSLLGQKPALADDSGLVVAALNGAPGIYSSRFAGIHASDKENIQLLLQQLEGLAENKRSAFFYCAIALVEHAQDPTPLIAVGKLEGSITLSPSGEEGFGYDPVFYLKSHACTLAQLPAAVKNTLSHRSKALKQLTQLLESQ